MDKLQEARKIINEVDDQMAELFVQRMKAAEMVAQYKSEHNLPVLDAAREAEVIRKGAERIQQNELRSYYKDFMVNTMTISRRYQQDLLICGKNSLTQIPVELGEHSYRVTIARKSLSKAHKYMNLNRKVLVVTDSGVPAQYAATVAGCCTEPTLITIQQGESSKSLENFEYLCRTMLENGFTRTDCVVAVGGGVVGDLAGFAAASYMRGIDFYNIPTTVLSQVDSSIGGKVAIDLGGIKNCVGAFHQPKAVLIDPDVLSTLPYRQIANGLAEAVKMAVNFDEALLKLFETENPMESIDQIIAASLKIKAKVVKEDERESGLRRVLNFGHTIGHGIEAASGMETYYHGECVAMGMLPMCSDDLRSRVEVILRKLRLPTTCRVDADAVWQAIIHDKKCSGHSITVVYAPMAGSYSLRTMPLEELKQTVYQFLNEGV